MKQEVEELISAQHVLRSKLEHAEKDLDQINQKNR